MHDTFSAKLILFYRGLKPPEQLPPGTLQGLSDFDRPGYGGPCPPMGRHRFQIPFNAAGKKWVRFAAWDSAGNGVMSQPRKIE